MAATPPPHPLEALERWLCRLSQGDDGTALRLLAERSGISPAKLSRPAPPETNVVELIEAARRYGHVSDLLRVLWTRGRRMPARREELIGIAVALGIDGLETTSTADETDDLAPLLAACEAAWTERLALRGTLETPLSRLYIDPLLGIPGLSGRKTLSAWLAGELPGPKKFVVTGEVGSGKTELLHVTAALLAARARRDDTAPIPLLIDAVELQRSGDVRAAALHAWPQARDAVTILLSDRLAPMVLLIDRLDETADTDLDARVARVCDEFAGRLIALVVTTRPSYRPAIGESTVVELPRWTETETRRFLDSLADSSPAAGTLRRLGSDRLMVRELLSNPLSATILAALGAKEIETLEHPADMFRALIDHLFQRWSRRRQRPPRWSAYTPSLQLWAREMIEGERSGISGAELRRLIRAEHPDACAEHIDDVELGLGVLIPRGDRHEFLFRSLAEHLAGRQFAADGVSAILGVARKPWAHEAIRHAAGCLRTAAERTELLSGLLMNEAADTPGVSDDNLRPVLTAIDVAADAHTIAPALAERLIGATFRRLVEEYSDWVGDEVASRMPRLLRIGGPVADELAERCVALLRPDGPTTAFPEDRAGLRDLLHHRYWTICRATIHKLHAFLEHVDVQWDLFQLIFDDRETGFDRSVGFDAALALRAVPRSQLDPTLLARLVALLDDERSGKPYAHAVLALLPGEAPLYKIAYNITLCIRRGLDTYAPIDSLLACPGAAEMLTHDHPEWRASLDSHIARNARSRPLPDVLAPSLTARMRLAEALSGRLHFLDEVVLISILDGSDNIHALMHCMDKLDPSLHSMLVERKLRTSWLCPGCRRALSGAAELHGDVRDLLLHWWNDTANQGPERDGARAYFPGELLEPLVLVDKDVARVYSEWIVEIVHTSFINTPSDVWSQAPFRCSQVMETVRDQIFDEHERPREGALRLLVKGWQGDPVIWKRLTEHVKIRFHREVHVCDVHAAYWPFDDQRPRPVAKDDLLTALAMVDVVPPSEFIEAFVAGCHVHLARALGAVRYTGSFGRVIPPRLFNVLRHLDLVNRLREPLCALAGVDRPPNLALGLHAAVLVVQDLDPAAQRGLSRLWAEHYRCTAQAELLPAAALSHLMSLDPAAWRSALIAITQSIEQESTYPHLALGILPGIPAELAREVLPRWLSASRSWRLPWIERAFAENYRARIDDKLREHAFATRRF